MNKRLTYFATIVITIFLGLASRKWSHGIPAFIAENAGDALWAMMVYFGFRFLMVRQSLAIALCFSFLFSFGIEFSQLYQASWINHWRSTLLGALILGKGFLGIDLIRYTAGILLALFLDYNFIRKRTVWCNTGLSFFLVCWLQILRYLCILQQIIDLFFNCRNIFKLFIRKFQFKTQLITAAFTNSCPFKVTSEFFTDMKL